MTLIPSSPAPSGDLLLRADGLSIRTGARQLLAPLSIELRSGDRLVILGESGAGKSLLLRCLLGDLPAELTADGSIEIAGQRSAAQHGHRRRPFWGRHLALLPQEPSVALDPLRTLAPQLAEVHRHVGGRSSAESKARTADTLRTHGLAGAAGRHAWQLSGGMAQRAAAAMALAGGARLILADEPTKGLDPHWRDEAIRGFLQVADQGGAVVVVTHDLAVARQVGGRIVVLREGEVVEQGATTEVLAHPAHGFTQQLVDADPARWPVARPPQANGDGTGNGAPLLRAQALGHYLGGRWLFRGLDLEVHAGSSTALLGSSGSGKSTLGNLLLGLRRPTEGAVVRSAGLAPQALQKLYQDPLATFAPTQQLREALIDVAKQHGQAWPAVQALLERFHLSPGLMERLPHQLSGGQLQRVAIARMLLVRPRFVFADEPTSRLDAVSQQRTAEVLLQAVRDLGAALWLVTHDADLAQAMTLVQRDVREWQGAEPPPEPSEAPVPAEASTG
jgi:peptide/nickel transport system ATP-binding protein